MSAEEHDAMSKMARLVTEMIIVMMKFISK